MINNHKTQGKWRIHSSNKIIERKTQSEWKIQKLTAEITFISSKPNYNETRTMYPKSDNIEIMMSSETEEVIKQLFESLSRRHKKELEKPMKGTEFVFDGVDALYYDLNKVRLSRGGSYIDSPVWLKNKKATINPKNNDGNCFKYVVTVALNHEQIKSHPERISNIKPFIDQCNWKGINFPTSPNLWKVFERNNKSIALNILYVPYNTKKINPA